MYTDIVAIIWDPEKLKTNIEKHGVRFSDAVPGARRPRRSHDHRLRIRPGRGAVLDVGDGFPGARPGSGHAWRGDDIRLISARVANARERKEYENQ